MKFDKNMLALYAITDRKCIGDRGLEYSVEQALSGGATMIQLRDKEVDFDTLCKEADSLLKICQKYGAPLIINDNADVVLKQVLTVCTSVRMIWSLPRREKSSVKIK
ncbi:MAG: thiamine phosphate synthase [Ruminococcus sp.]